MHCTYPCAMQIKIFKYNVIMASFYGLNQWIFFPQNYGFCILYEYYSDTCNVFKSRKIKHYANLFYVNEYSLIVYNIIYDLHHIYEIFYILKY